MRRILRANDLVVVPLQYATNMMKHSSIGEGLSKATLYMFRYLIKLPDAPTPIQKRCCTPRIDKATLYIFRYMIKLPYTPTPFQKRCCTPRIDKDNMIGITLCMHLLKHQRQVHGNKVSKHASKDTTIKNCMYMYEICVSIFSIIIIIVIVVQCHYSYHVAWSLMLLSCNIAQTKKTDDNLHNPCEKE